jgi:Domain of unknown function (DUF4124)
MAAALLAFVVSEESIAAAKDSEKATDPPIYRYVDRQGRTVFTNDLSRIPAEFRPSATIVELPPAVTLPAPKPPPQPKPPSFSTRVREWIQSQPPAYRLILVGVVPVLILSLWVMHFLRKRSDSAGVKFSLRMGMLVMLFLSAYLCYVIFIRAQASRLIGSVPGGNEIISSPKEKAKALKKDEADRLKSIENIANQKNDDEE